MNHARAREHTHARTRKDGLVNRRQDHCIHRGPQRQDEALRGGSNLKPWKATSRRLAERCRPYISGFPPFPLRGDLSGAACVSVHSRSGGASGCPLLRGNAISPQWSSFPPRIWYSSAGPIALLCVSAATDWTVVMTCALRKSAWKPLLWSHASFQPLSHHLDCGSLWKSENQWWNHENTFSASTWRVRSFF